MTDKTPGWKVAILPTARRCLTIPGLAEHGRKTLEFWGEA